MLRAIPARNSFLVFPTCIISVLHASKHPLYFWIVLHFFRGILSFNRQVFIEKSAKIVVLLNKFGFWLNIYLYFCFGLFILFYLYKYIRNLAPLLKTFRSESLWHVFNAPCSKRVQTKKSIFRTRIE